MTSSCGYCGMQELRLMKVLDTTYNNGGAHLDWCDAGQRYACVDAAACAGRIRAKRAGMADTEKPTPPFMLWGSALFAVAVALFVCHGVSWEFGRAAGSERAWSLVRETCFK